MLSRLLLLLALILLPFSGVSRADDCDLVVKTVDELWTSAKDLAKAHETQQALDILDQIRAINPKHEKAISLTAKVLTDAGQYEDALAELNHGIAIAPTNTVLQNQKQIVLHRLGRSSEARALAKNISANPGATKKDLRASLGMQSIAALKEGRFEDVLKVLEQLIPLEPEQTGNYVRKAIALLNLERRKEAILAADQALKLDSNSAAALGVKADSLAYLDRNTEALEILNRLIELHKDNPDPREFRRKLKVQIRLGQYKEAVKLADDYLDRFEEDEYVTYWRGQALQELERKKLRSR